MSTLIVTGGNINTEFLKETLEKTEFETIIAADKGLEALNKINVMPNYIIGDFDSVNKTTLNQYENKNIEITYLKPEKDFTDTHMAIKLAIEKRAKHITIIGATGTRMDHTLANIHVLNEALQNNVPTEIINENNRIMLINRKAKLIKNTNYKYVSIIPLTTKITGVTLKGFKYNIENATINLGESIGVSNEQIEQEALIEIKEGIAILIYSKD